MVSENFVGTAPKPEDYPPVFVPAPKVTAESPNQAPAPFIGMTDEDARLRIGRNGYGGVFLHFCGLEKDFQLLCSVLGAPPYHRSAKPGYQRVSWTLTDNEVN